MMYCHEFAINSSVVHSDLTFVANMPRIFLVNAFGLGHINFQKLFLRSTSIICEVLHIYDVKPDLRKALYSMELLSAEVAAREIYPLDTSPEIPHA